MPSLTEFPEWLQLALSDMTGRVACRSTKKIENGALSACRPFSIYQSGWRLMAASVASTRKFDRQANGW